MRREEQYRQYLEKFEEIQNEKWIKELPLKDMIRYRWISDSSDVYKSCLDFFGVDNLDNWMKRYSELELNVNFRTSRAYKSNIASIATWIRQGELQANNIICDAWDPELFLETLYKLKPLTRSKRPQAFLPQLITECAKCGVAVSIVPSPSGARASGATKFINDKKALVVLSFRHLSDDHFWFTFFHEAGHLIMKHKSQNIFIDLERTSNTKNEEEREANIFAGELLISEKYRAQMKNLRGNKRKIISFSQDVGVSPGIVVGQMQHLGIIEHNYLNGYKRYFDWEDINESIFNLQNTHN